MVDPKERYKVFNLRNFRDIPQVRNALSEEERRDIEIVGSILPFKVNNYIIKELIDWWNIPDDPVYQLTFPQKNMLSESHFRRMKSAMDKISGKLETGRIINDIRHELNPHPAGQVHNIPEIDGKKLNGIQHKYRETVLFFPNSCQTCHAYCTFCFRWPQFTGLEELKFAMKEVNYLVKYIKRHPEITDVLITGGDPMVMSAKKFKSYIDPLIKSELENLQTIRIGTKSLSYWPYKFLTDHDADDMLRIFEKIVKKGFNLAFMAHINHPNELKTMAVQKAIKKILATGAQIRTQSPVMKHINDDPDTWMEMWKLQVKLGMIPYYMFVARNTGAQEYFAISLEKALRIYKTAYQQVSGIARTVRGPSMSATPGKVQVLGINEIQGEKVFTLQFIQGRNPNWVRKPFFAKYNPDAIWLDDLEPAFGEENFFFEIEPRARLSVS